MKLDEVVAWYQKKIGTYDEQQWEKTVEQKILDGFSSVTLKTAKLKTELIDVDLVRGSTFPKAKPKQSLITVIRLAIQRYFFLPVYAQWWVKQTSPNLFGLLFALYMLQMVSWAIYTYNSNRGGIENGTSLNNNNQNITTIKAETDGDSAAEKISEDHIVSISDLLIPMVLSLLLSLIHSQIVATNTLTGAKAKRRRFSNTASNSGLNNKICREPRIKRRKKLVKIRSQEATTTTTATTDGIIRKSISAQTLKKCIFNDQTESSISGNHAENQCDSCLNPTSLINHTNYHQPYSSATISNTTSIKYPAKLTLDLNNATVSSPNVDFYPNNNNNNNDDGDPSNVSNKKRNVNWHSPIHNYAIETQEKQQQTTPQTQSTSSSSDTPNTPNNPNSTGPRTTTQNSTSSNSSSNNSRLPSPNKTVRIDECVQEFYEDLIIRADEQQILVTPTESQATIHNRNDDDELTINADDDGFESLNGKSLSGEECNATLFPSNTKSSSASALRYRLNANKENKIMSTVYRRKVPLSSESDVEKNLLLRPTTTTTKTDDFQQQTTKAITIEDDVTTDHTDEDGDYVENASSPASMVGNNSNYTECTTSATEWLGVTTNSDECSYSSELENSDDYNKNQQYSDEDGYEMDFAPTTILNPRGSSDRISCTIWEQKDIKKAQMSVLEISSCIIERVESMPETNDYIYMGIVFSLLLSFVPIFCRLCEVTIDSDKSNELSYWDLPMLLWEKASFSFFTVFHFAFGQTNWERTVLMISLMQRFCLTMILFVIFAVAERTLKQRFLYAKLFSHLTSSRRAQKSNLPHFRLNKVRNIKTWLCVRSYLKKRGPQRSVDVIVSAAFLVTHLLLAFLSVEWLKGSGDLHSHLNLEALMWSSTIGIFLLRFMTLGNKIHDKYRSVSVLITEQINLYLQIEQKPKKKDELMVANSVLKLAADLLKELESPFKISGLSANPYLFTTLKVVILSALSGVLSEMLGFKLKLLKIKIK